jgi:hypothetical protein
MLKSDIVGENTTSCCCCCFPVSVRSGGSSISCIPNQRLILFETVDGGTKDVWVIWINRTNARITTSGSRTATHWTKGRSAVIVFSACTPILALICLGMTRRLDKRAKISIVESHAVVLLLVGVIIGALLQVQMCKGLCGKAKRQVVLVAAVISTCCCCRGGRADGEGDDDTQE